MKYENHSRYLRFYFAIYMISAQFVSQLNLKKILIYLSLYYTYLRIIIYKMIINDFISSI